MKYLQTTIAVERGILTSKYKQELKHQSQLAKAASLSKIKLMILNQSNLESQTGTILRVSLFVIAIVMITF
ncbi:MAG: hypothetical protein ACJAYY_002077 [Paraglaciecola sp.]|jgi:hypothetical protein|uniref:hypothetical protein n=1 Tax=Polaribacter sp. TaxID=1920175 RepID=UPI003AD79292|tara:strand:+ start:3454 stop:3666 length:213 start_codon:yes stop_codon:yes gene_type:complete